VRPGLYVTVDDFARRYGPVQDEAGVRRILVRIGYLPRRVDEAPIDRKFRG